MEAAEAVEKRVVGRCGGGGGGGGSVASESITAQDTQWKKIKVANRLNLRPPMIKSWPYSSGAGVFNEACGRGMHALGLA